MSLVRSRQGLGLYIAFPAENTEEGPGFRRVGERETGEGGLQF